MLHHSQIFNLLKAYNIQPEKRLGQNFLTDNNVAGKIIKAAGNIEGKTVLEIGAGMGQLTRFLLNDSKAKTVIAVEFDRKCLAYLYDLQKEYPEKLIVIAEDALKLNEHNLAKDTKLSLISNLPYNISVILLLKWLKMIDLFEVMVLMFQREVAERITAIPNTKAYGVLSILTQYLCHADLYFHVSPNCFFPAPKIESSVVLFKPMSNASERLKLYEDLRAVCNTAFSQRRKMAKNTLQGTYRNIVDIFNRLGIPENSRPEDLTISDFENITKTLKQRF